jgi:hypothetical protein
VRQREKTPFQLDPASRRSPAETRRPPLDQLLTQAVQNAVKRLPKRPPVVAIIGLRYLQALTQRRDDQLMASR